MPVTARQLEILSLWLKGTKQNQIAEQLGVSKTRVAEVLHMYMQREEAPTLLARGKVKHVCSSATGCSNKCVARKTFNKLTRNFKSFEVALEVKALLEAHIE